MDAPAIPAPRRCTTLTIRNDCSELARVAAWLEQSAANFGLSGPLAFRLDLVLNEALPNIFAYAYRDDSNHEIAIVLTDAPDRVVLEITDDGIPFDPWSREPFVEAASVADASITGRGIHLIRSFTDEQAYYRLANSNTIRLSLYKSNRASPPGVSD